MPPVIAPRLVGRALLTRQIAVMTQLPVTEIHLIQPRVHMEGALLTDDRPQGLLGTQQATGIGDVERHPCNWRATACACSCPCAVSGRLLRPQ